MVQNDLERVTDRSEEYEAYEIILWLEFIIFVNTLFL